MSDDNAANDGRLDSGNQTRATEQSRARAEELKKRFELRQRPEGFYLSDEHLVSVNAALQALQASQSVVFVSPNHAMARHYKELCISRLRDDPAIKLLSFDPLSGPDLLSIINGQLEDTSLDAMLTPDSAQPRKQSTPPRSVLIVDSEDLVTETDWHLIVTLASQLAGANIGVLRLEPRDRFSAPNKSANLSSSLAVEFELPSERELQILAALAKLSPVGEEVMRLVDDLEFVRPTANHSNADVTQEEMNKEDIDEQAAFISGADNNAVADNAVADRESVAGLADGSLPPSNPVPEHEALKQSGKGVTSTEVAHLSFRLFLGLVVVEALLIMAYFNQ